MSLVAIFLKQVNTKALFSSKMTTKIVITIQLTLSHNAKSFQSLTGFYRILQAGTELKEEE